MKKLTAIAMGAALLGALWTAPASAAVVGSRHDMADAGNTRATLQALNTFGTCSACHLPHGAGADRLFPSSSGSLGGFFGPLCGSCHSSAIIANDVDLNFNTTVLDSHGSKFSIDTLAAMGDQDGIAGGQAATAGLKYLSLADSPRATQVNEIECLSCHDVHNQNGNRPFLITTLDNLCEACHLGRVNDATTTTGWTNAFANGSTHPAGAAFTGDVSGIASAGAGGDSPIATTIATFATYADAAPAGSTWGDAIWNSGAHATGGGTWRTGTGTDGGVDCATCHVVHWDENAGTPNNGSAFYGLVNEGTSTVYNAFCEECHQGRNVLSDGATGAGSWWNPGNTLFSHPNDNVSAAAINSADLALPLGQFATTSARTGTGGSGIVCTGCHGVHPQDSTSPETEINTPILLNYDNTAYSDVCNACHAGTVTGFLHHPVGATLYNTLGNDAGVTCAGGILGGAQLGQCHGSGGPNGAIAHNRTSPMANPPTNNASMCTSCHSTNPSTYTPANTWTANGEASHFVGNITAGNNGTFSARTTACDGTNGFRFAGSNCSSNGNATGWVGTTSATKLLSKYGPTALDFTCESCHRLAIGNIESGNRTADPVNLLVEVSGHAAETVSTPGAQTAVDYTALPYLCTGCHLVPSGTHPLFNADATVYALGATAQGQDYTAGNHVNCESCHSPHDASTTSGSYILDGSSAGTFGAGAGMDVEPVIDYTNFCAVCHSAFQ